MLITDYIKSFAESSLKSFKWHSDIIYPRAIITTLSLIRSNTNANPEYLLRVDETLKNYALLFKSFSMYVLFNARQHHLIEIIIENQSPFANSIYHDFFEASLKNFMQNQGILHNNPFISGNIARLSDMKIPMMVLCWYFIYIVKKNNIIDKAIEELYLLEEIEAFKNR